MRLRTLSKFLISTFLLTPLALADCPELLTNGDFESGTTSGWSYYSDGGHYFSYAIVADPYTAGNEYLELDYEASGSNYDMFDAGIQTNVSVTAGETYRLTFYARGDDFYGDGNGLSDGHVSVTAVDPPYDNYGLGQDFDWVDGDGDDYSFEFTANTTGPALLNFFYGTESIVLVIDSISLSEITSSECDATGGASGSGGAASGGSASGGSASGGTTGNSGGIGGQIHNNQLAYVTGAEKVATLVHTSTSPVDWELRNASGAVVDSGQTSVSGLDTASSDHTHLIDFSSYDSTGSGYRLWVGSAAGPAFSIGGSHFAQLRRDALRFFYHHRASEAISSTHSEGSEHARAAGHTDSTVTCTSSSECSYFLDTRSGWYDAGDYGKYVVNGGIALWTLLNLYERTEHLGTDQSALGDDTTNIPESGNGVSDLLDEAKKELVFMMGMQVPAGENLAGMAHHKVHSASWDTIPVAPANALPHFLRPPSTAATLNLAATTAQCARIYATIDPDFASRCLNAAESAYKAAVAHPKRFAPASDGDGGGAYNDADVSDEFYWAAAELFVTTGTSSYLDDVLTSEHHGNPPREGDVLAWPTTATLGMITLASVPSDLSNAEREAVRAALVLRARDDLDRAQSGYGSTAQGYWWGSNSSVLNGSLLQAIAYDLTGEADHRAAALAGLDYVLGRNPLGQSYVSGYGAQPFQNPHHRFWAFGFNSSWPAPPPGVLAGGPNESLDGMSSSEVASQGLTGCAPSKCWSDYPEGYSLTEVTINWNAPLAWLASWASEQQTDPKDDFPGVDLDALPGGDGDGDSTTTGDGDGDSTSDSSDDGDGDSTSDSSGDGDGDSSGGDGDACSQGEEDCACYPNETCNDDLSCENDICVASDDSGRAPSDKGGCSQAPSPAPSRAPWLWIVFLGSVWIMRRRLNEWATAQGRPPQRSDCTER